MNKFVNTIINRAIREDIGTQDVTTNLLIPNDEMSNGYIIVKEDAVLCGIDVAKGVFQKLDKQINFRSHFKDGDRVHKNTKIIFLRGKTRTLLTAERTVLNFLTHLSGIATKTNSFVRKATPFKVKILDTRKTIPGMRLLQKNAVRCGGGINHRSNLREMIFIKDNHQTAMGGKYSWMKIIASLREKTDKKIEVEVENLSQFKAVLKAQPDIILLDNMAVHQIKKAVVFSKKLPRYKRPQLEVSGRISLNNISSYARTGVDMISVGELTHSFKSIDMSLEIQN